MDTQLATKVKTHCEGIGLPSLELMPEEADSSSQLVAQMMKEFAQMVRVPVTPLNIARTVTLGSLYVHDEDELVRFTKKGAVNFIKPVSPPTTAGREEDGHKGSKPKTIGQAPASSSVLSGRGIAFQGASDQTHQASKMKRTK